MTSFTDRVAIVATMASSALSTEIAPEGWSSEGEDKENKENNQERRKRLRLSLKRKVDEKKEERFRSTSPKKLRELSSYNPPANTKANTSWAMHNYEQWFNWRSSSAPDESCPEEVLLPSCSAEVLGKWLPVYITETRNKKGNFYPPKTLYSLLTAWYSTPYDCPKPELSKFSPKEECSIDFCGVSSLPG